MSDTQPAHEYLETAERAVEEAATKGIRAATVPLSIAVMAVIAAVLGSLETTAASTAVLARSDAAVKQGEVSDLWGFYQAKSIKKNLFEIAADERAGNQAFHDKAEKAAAEENDLRTKAEAKEQDVKTEVALSETAMERHHRLTVATSLVHLAIALASISLVIGKRWLWVGALVSVGAGLAAAII